MKTDKMPEPSRSAKPRFDPGEAKKRGSEKVSNKFETQLDRDRRPVYSSRPARQCLVVTGSESEASEDEMKVLPTYSEESFKTC